VVNLASNIITSGNIDVVRRWDKKNKTYLHVERPEIVQKYNKSMSGVDNMDKLISYYRTFIKSRKWTLRMIAHAFDMTAANCWLTYIKDAEYFKILKNKRYDLLHFRMELANGLINVGKPTTTKRKKGRSCTKDDYEPPNKASPTSSNRKVDGKLPSDKLRIDTVDHLPDFDELKNATKCKLKTCTHRTHVLFKMQATFVFRWEK